MLQAPAANAMPMTFVGSPFRGANRSIPSSSPGNGSRNDVLDPTAERSQINATFQRLDSNDRQARIHWLRTAGY